MGSHRSPIIAILATRKRELLVAIAALREIDLVVIRRESGTIPRVYQHVVVRVVAVVRACTVLKTVVVQMRVVSLVG